MKKLAVLFFFISFVSLGQVANTLIPQAATIAELKTKPVDEGAIYLVLGIAEQNGGLFYYSSTATAPEDAPYYNYVTSTVSGTGRWMRNTVRNQLLPAGFLETNGQIKTITLNGTTNASGMATFYLTYDGTATGAAIPTQTPFQVSAFPQPAIVGSANDIVLGECQPVSTDRKSVICRYGRGASQVLGVLGLTVLGMRDAAVSTPVSIQVKTM